MLILVLFSVLVLHWVTHQDDFEADLTRCGTCHRSLGGGGRYSLNSAAFTGAGHGRSLGAQVTTNCEAGKHTRDDKSMPPNAIITNTEFHHDIESCEELSEAESSGKRASSTEHIRQKSRSS